MLELPLRARGQASQGAPVGTPSTSPYPRPLPSPHPSPHTLTRAQRDVLATPLRCRDDAPPAAPPPLASRLRWSKPWRPDADNDARFLGSALRFGRCTAKENACELRGRPSSATPYPSGAGWASCLVNKHRQHVPGRKPPSTLATVTNIVSRLTPTLLPHRTSARKLSQ